MNWERTGRTGRMLDEALRLDAAGKAVYIVALDDNHAKTLESMLIHKHIGVNLNSVKIEPVARFPEFDFEKMELRGAHPNCVVLVDHAVIESKFSKMLDMLYRYVPEKHVTKTSISKVDDTYGMSEEKCKALDDKIMDYYSANIADWRETIGNPKKFAAFVDKAALTVYDNLDNMSIHAYTRRFLYGLWK